MKVAAVLLLIICIVLPSVGTTSDSIPSLTIQSLLAESSGPTIDWMYGDGVQNVTIAWDGVYDGQTEDTWSHWVWVNDTDGVDTVLFMYMWIGESNWRNVTGILKEGNATRGCYNGNVSYRVWWNYTSSRPEWEGSGGNFHFKVFANDTLGHWSESPILTYTGGYMIVKPPTPFFLTPPGLTIIAAVVVGTAIIALVAFKKRL
jgi:hypothetical protein